MKHSVQGDQTSMRTEEYRLCSVVSQEAGDDPAGSAGSFSTALMVEIPPPWSRDVAQSKRFPAGLQDALAAAQKASLFQKFTAFMPERDRSVKGFTRVFCFSRPEVNAGFARYEKAEFLVPTEGLAASIEGVLSGSDEYFIEDARDTREVFVCVHNNRDVCCGRFGTELHRALKKVESDVLRLWRCSHLGGHRFAPTMIEFPTGMVWGHVKAESAASLISREMPAAEAARFSRGWPGLASHYEQIADRDALAKEGWGWLDTPRSARITSLHVDSDAAEVEISTPESTLAASVEPNGSVMTLASSGTEPLMQARQYRVRATEKRP